MCDRMLLAPAHRQHQWGNLQCSSHRGAAKWSPMRRPQAVPPMSASQLWERPVRARPDCLGSVQSARRWTGPRRPISVIDMRSGSGSTDVRDSRQIAGVMLQSLVHEFNSPNGSKRRRHAEGADPPATWFLRSNAAFPVVVGAQHLTCAPFDQASTAVGVTLRFDDTVCQTLPTPSPQKKTGARWLQPDHRRAGTRSAPLTRRGRPTCEHLRGRLRLGLPVLQASYRLEN